MSRTHTHTYTELEVSKETLEDIHKRLAESGVDTCPYINDEEGREVIYLPGIQLIQELTPRLKAEGTPTPCDCTRCRERADRSRRFLRDVAEESAGENE
jgi:hypothetical protein